MEKAGAHQVTESWLCPMPRLQPPATWGGKGQASAGVGAEGYRLGSMSRCLPARWNTRQRGCCNLQPGMAHQLLTCPTSAIVSHGTPCFGARQLWRGCGKEQAPSPKPAGPQLQLMSCTLQRQSQVSSVQVLWFSAWELCLWASGVQGKATEAGLAQWAPKALPQHCPGFKTERIYSKMEEKDPFQMVFQLLRTLQLPGLDV